MPQANKKIFTLFAFVHAWKKDGGFDNSEHKYFIKNPSKKYV